MLRWWRTGIPPRVFGEVSRRLRPRSPRLAALHGVRVVRPGFAEFRSTERFGLLLSAEAWHRMRPGTRRSLAADMLEDEATPALF